MPFNKGDHAPGKSRGKLVQPASLNVHCSSLLRSLGHLQEIATADIATTSPSTFAGLSNSGTGLCGAFPSRRAMAWKRHDAIIIPASVPIHS